MRLHVADVNALLEARVRDLAARRPAESLHDHLLRVRLERPILVRALGLEPFPNGGALNAAITGVILRDGYRIEKLVYESRVGFPVTAHLYLPDRAGKFPLILRPHGHWPGKKSEPIVQASAIGLALAGFAVLVVDSPGDYGELPQLNERAELGPHDDPWLSMGAPLMGFYIYDLMRGVDYLSTRPEIDQERIGITGASGGGLASMLAFALDERIGCAAIVCYGSSMEVQPHNGCLCNHIPGIMALGDRSDILALRAPAPVLLVGASDDPEFPERGMLRTHEKLAGIYRKFDRAVPPRVEIVDSLHDYNRRMREVVLAFFDHHLQGRERRSYRSELRPITDGIHNAAPAETLPVDSPELRVLPQSPAFSTTMREFLEKTLTGGGNLPVDFAARLVPWAKYKRLSLEATQSVLQLSDAELDLENLDLRSCIVLGLSPFELVAQILHIMLPGGIEGWENSTLGPGGDVVSSLIGSMRALVGSVQPPVELAEVQAHGPVTSMVARVLQTYRPKLRVVLSDPLFSWEELYRTGNPALIQPGARYLRWPFDPLPSKEISTEGQQPLDSQ